MGADRRGPLAAFVVIAIIAAVLLVTSVRSQAAPGWLDPDHLPAVVVAAPPATDPHLWVAVTSGIPRVVEHGVVLVQRMTSDPTTTAEVTTLTVASVPVGATDTTDSAGTAPPEHAAPVQHRGPSQRRDSASAPDESTTPGHGPGGGHGHDPGHGRHSGWSHANHAHAHAHGSAHGRHHGWSRHHS